jgi:hypothetical protein
VCGQHNLSSTLWNCPELRREATTVAGPGKAYQVATAGNPRVATCRHVPTTASVASPHPALRPFPRAIGWIDFCRTTNSLAKFLRC